MKILELADMLRIEMNLKAALCTLERVERLTRNAFGTSLLHKALASEINTLRWALERHQAPDVKYRNPPKTPKAWKLGWPSAPASAGQNQEPGQKESCHDKIM